MVWKVLGTAFDPSVHARLLISLLCRAPEAAASASCCQRTHMEQGHTPQSHMPP